MPPVVTESKSFGAPQATAAIELTDQERVAATSDPFLRRFIDLWILFAIGLWIIQFTTMPTIRYPSYVMLAAGLPARFAMRADRMNLARYLFIVPLCAGAIVIPLFTNGVRTPVIASLPMLVLLAGWLLGRRAMVSLTAFFVLSVAWFWLSEAEGWFVISVPLRSPDIWSLVWVSVTALTSIVVWSLVGNYEANHRQERELLRQLAQTLRRAEAANGDLTEALDFNETIIFNSPLPMGVYAASGKCVVANDAFAQLVGATREDLLAQNFHTIGTWQRSSLLADCLAALADQVARRREAHFVTSFGNEVWLEYTILPTHLKGEKHLLIQFFNVTERKLAEEMLHAANARLAEREHFILAVTDNLPGLVAYVDVDLRGRFANKRHIEWFNKTPQELNGMRLQDFLGARRFATNEPYLRRALLGEEQNFEGTATKASGEIRNTWTNYIPDRDASGNVIGIFVLVSDLTALKQAEEAQRIAATAFESQEVMMITDANTLILRVNRAFTETTGYTSEDIVSQTPRLLKSGRHDVAFYAAMWDSINRSGSWQGEIWDRRKNGEIYPNWSTITAVKGGDGIVTHYVGTQTDITLRKAAEEAIKHLAFFDALTGLPNRRLLIDRLRQTLTTSIRTEREGALMFIDLDNFKILNDTLGHDKGDILLQQVAERLSECVREGDTVARLGGDEFVVLLEELSKNPEEAAMQAEAVGKKILAALNQPYDLAGQQHRSTPSIGVTLFTEHKHSIEELLKRADLAMYQTKSAGRNCLRFFDSTV